VTGSKEQILTAELLLAHLIANIPGYVYWKDKEGVYQGCNRHHAHRLGVRQSIDVIGKTDGQLLEREGNQRFSHYDQIVLSQGQTRVIEEVITLNGQTVILLSLKSPLFGKRYRKRRQVLGVLSISLDITRERRLEERVRAYQEKQKELTMTALPSLSLKRILIVKTDSLITEELQQVFQKAGCVVDVVHNPGSAFQQMQKEYYTLIFMDTNLRDIDGIKFAKKMRQQSKKNRDTPIIGFDACR